MKRRVLFVDHVRRILGGAEVNLLELLGDPAVRAAWEPQVACDPAGRLQPALRDLGIPCHDFGFGDAVGTLRLVGRSFPLAGAVRAWRELARARRNLAALVESVRPDVVVSCTNKDHFAAWPGARRAGVPSVWWVNDVISADFFPWLARRMFLHQARQGATRLVVVSEFAGRALTAGGLPAERVVTIHNGIPLERYTTTTRGTLRHQLGIAGDEPLVGMLGRITPWKGQELFLRVAEAWCRREARGRFVVVGHAFNEDQPFEARLRARVRSQGREDRIHFLPFQPDVVSVLADLDLLVHASVKPEPFGRVVIEAMALGVPVLAAAAGGIPEIIEPDGSGLLATPGDEAAFLAGLGRILGDAALRRRLGEAGRRSVARHFTLSRVRRQFEDLVTSLT